MASVQELLLAAQSKAPRSAVAPLLDLLDTGISGYQAGQGIRDKNTEIAYQLIKKQQIEQEIAQKAADQQRNAEANARIQQRLNEVSSRKGVLPSQKLTEKISRDKDGNYSNDFVIEDNPKDRSGGLSPDLIYRMQKDAEKKAADLQELQIPGYTHSGPVRPTTKEAQDLRESSAQINDFTNGIDEMIKMVRKYGSTNTIGEGSGEMKALHSNLVLKLKDAARLGQISSTDMAIIEGQVFNPTGLGSVGTTTETAIKQLETAKQRALDARASALSQRGYAPEKQPAQRASTGFEHLSDEDLQKRINELKSKEVKK